MDLVLIFGSAILGTLVMGGIAVIIVKVLGGNKMKPTRKEIDEIEEPDMDDAELLDEEQEEQPQKQRKAPQKICVAYLTNGSKPRGIYMGEEPQFVTLPPTKEYPKERILKQDSTWVEIRTEKSVLRLNKQQDRKSVV